MREREGGNRWRRWIGGGWDNLKGWEGLGRVEMLSFCTFPIKVAVIFLSLNKALEINIEILKKNSFHENSSILI